MSSRIERVLLQQNQQLADLDASIALIRGTYGLAEDPNRSFSRGVRIMKLYNAMTMLTGIAQTVDTARLVMINGIGKTFKMNWDIMTSGYAKEIWKMNMKTTQLGGEALDLWNRMLKTKRTQVLQLQPLMQQSSR